MILTASATLLTPTVRSQVASSPLDLDKATLARFLDQCHRRKYPNRTDVFRPGDAATTLYYVVTGSVSVISEESEDRELVLSYANPGDFVGEMGLFVKADTRVVTAWSSHEGDRFPAAVRIGACVGVQFHPEKSSAPGVRFVESFLEAARAATLPSMVTR